MVNRMSTNSRPAFLPGLLLVVAAILLNGCAIHSRVDNSGIQVSEPIDDWAEKLDMPLAQRGNVLLLLAFSGGGTRAAAFSYGVLQELRDTAYGPNGSMRLLDEVDGISSVSGGSFTAAYYGLFGDQLFEDYEQVFLKNNIQKTLLNGIFNPLNWWKMLTTGFDRTELAVDYYDTYIFKGKTFADLINRHGPYIQINATDLSLGQRFSFTQGYFDLLCSDYAGFSIARAVAASSAVPIAFAPVVLENYDTCTVKYPDWFVHARERAAADPRLAEKVAAVMSYTDKEQRKFIHLVDGGITDNLGIRTLYDRVSLMGGSRNAAAELEKKSIDKIVILLVNAQTKPSQPMEQSEDEPPVVEVINAVTDAQLQRYNTETLILVKNSLKKWAAELSTAGREIKPYFIIVDFNSIEDLKKRHLFNNIATSFALPASEVESLVDTARSLLRDNHNFKRLVRDLE